jgi:putative DNA primase/helicase
MIGYSLLPDCRFEKFFLLYGDGQTGKSTVVETWQSLLGAGNVSSVPLEQFGRRFGLFPLVGKLANIVFDSSEIDQEGEGPLKAIVSGEPVLVEQKHKDALNRRLTAKLIFVANVLPAFRDTSSGLWRRMQLLHFPNQVADDCRDTNLKATLRGELPGILHWALLGLGRLLRQGAFTRHERGEVLLEQYRRDSNPVAVFVGEECVLDADARESRKAAYQHFRRWSADNGFRPISSTEFNKKIAQLHAQPANQPRAGRGGDRMFVGFRLRGAGDMASQFRGLVCLSHSRN